jgi:hypothetical protein
MVGVPYPVFIACPVAIVRVLVVPEEALLVITRFVVANVATLVEFKDALDSDVVINDPVLIVFGVEH